MDCLLALPFVCPFELWKSSLLKSRFGLLKKGPTTFNLTMTCRFCYQLPREQMDCVPLTNCNSVNRTSLFQTTCTALDEVLCLGNRTFPMNVECNFTTGRSWLTSLLLSIFLGGFGADRFYLGYTGIGVAKLLLVSALFLSFRFFFCNTLSPFL